MPISNPEETHRLFADAANAGDVDALVALYEPDAAIVEQDGSLSAGRDRVRTHIEELIALRPQMEIVESRAFRNRDIALLCSRWRARLTLPDGKEVQMDSRGSEVARRQPDGSWRLSLDNPWGVDLNGK